MSTETHAKLNVVIYDIMLSAWIVRITMHKPQA